MQAEADLVGAAPLPGDLEARGERARDGADAARGHQHGEAGAADVEHLAREDDLADVGHADAQHGGGRGAQQRADLGAAGELADAGARLREQRRAALGRRLAGGARGVRMPAISSPLTAKETALSASSPSVGQHEQQQRRRAPGRA